ncbi:hypothetical protein M569_02799, partial [Genlisea aurea]
KSTSNGRSPLVNRQSQITAFFGKKMGLLPSPSSGGAAGLNPDSGGITSTETPPLQSSKRKKPLLVSSSNKGSSSSSRKPNKEYGPEVVDLRVRVFWPLDKSWYDGCVMSFDEVSGRHLVKYDDGEEEMLNLSDEKIDWIEGTTRKFRRLRKFSLLEEDDEEEQDLKEVEDNSSDDDWLENAEKEEVIDDDVLEDIDFEEETTSDGRYDNSRRNSAKRSLKDGEQLGTASGKRRKIAQGNCAKASESSVPVKKQSGPPQRTMGNGKSSMLDSPIVGDDGERFDARSQKFRFLDVDRKDANGRRPGDENYDPRTLHLPLDFLKSISAGQRQWWEFKSKHMDKVLFFKMGKFYELFEMDAHIGAKELGLQYMKGEQPHCGFPEKNFSVNVDKLARKGYRVLVVEQTETPEQLEIRRREKGSKDKVV